MARPQRKTDQQRIEKLERVVVQLTELVRKLSDAGNRFAGRGDEIARILRTTKIDNI